jgi:hypothetical protein
MAKTGQRVLLSFRADPYQRADLGLTRRVLQVLVEYGVKFDVLTKNPRLALADAELFLQGGGRLATTVLFWDDRYRAIWEPGAPPVMDRVDAIEEAHEKGIETWVSVEPVIDPTQALKVIDGMKDFVDGWKVGKLNYLQQAEFVNWRVFAGAVYEKLVGTGRPYVIKKSLATFLPAGARVIKEGA